jgi:L,D-transpeptidase-like protein
MNVLASLFHLVFTVATAFAAPGFSSAEPVAAAAPVAATTTVSMNAAESAVKAAESALDATEWTNEVLGGVNPKVFSLALKAANAAIGRGDIAKPTTLTVIDFSLPSTEKRMWVYDLRRHALLFEEFVSHGRGSGRERATSFSNEPESNKSSIGLYRTGEVYVGKHGESLRLDGLERGFNDRARERAIVMHAADYVNGAAAKAQGFLGRSLGCPAVRPEITRQLIDTVKGGGLLFAYYPDPSWLGASEYLN